MKSIRTKLLWSHVALAFVTAIVMPVATFRFMQGQLLDSLERQLEANAAAVSEALAYVWTSGEMTPEGRARALRDSRFASRVMGAQVRLINARGDLLVDTRSLRPPAPMKERREVRSALRGRSSSAIRGPKGIAELWVAIPVRDERGIIGAAYVGAAVETALRARWQIAARLVVASLMSFTVAFALSMVMASAIARPVTQLTQAASRLSLGDFSVRVQPLWQDEVAALTLTFNVMAERLQRVDTERRAFLADVAHELRTPLTSIKGNAETLLSEAPRETAARRFAQHIIQQTDRLSRLVNDLLQLARLEAGAVSMQQAPVDLAAAVAGVCDELQSIAETREVHIELTAPGAPMIRGDHAHIAQALSNLISNAIRYAPPATAVAVRLETDSLCAVVTVTDRGPGIAPEHLAHIFERFYRADPAREQLATEQGSGLGLAIARRLIEAHGGSITATSRVPEGTTMTVRLPRE